MKVQRKKRQGIRIEHNSKLLILIIVLLIALVFVIARISYNKDEGAAGECKSDEDCVPVCGCHPEQCVPVKQRGECPKVFCSQVCSGPLDCNLGHCVCAESKCQIAPE